MSSLNARDFPLWNEIGEAIRRGIALLEKHPSVERMLSLELSEDNDCVEVKVAVRLELPNQWMAAGASPNGVLAVEPVTFSFSQHFSIRAPIVKLRADFNRSLAHIQPGSPASYILPCLYDGDIDELFHDQGIWAIINQVVAWLEKAALNELINPHQGWEPIRRDVFEDIIVADSDYLRNWVSLKERYLLLPFAFLSGTRMQPASGASKRFLVYGQVGKHPLKFKHVDALVHEQGIDKNCLICPSIALVISPDKLPCGELCVADQYLPECVTDLASLRYQAKEYGCAENLRVALSCLERKFFALDVDAQTVSIALILCVRRPFPLIGESSDLELIPYVFHGGVPELFINGEQTTVFPAAHLHTITPQLLQTFSGELSAPGNRDVVMVGCGSLGSKIAIHMARSGVAPSVVIDKEISLPHNAARHGLLPQGQDMNLTWVDSKARNLAHSIKGLGQSTKAFHEDVTQVARQPKRLKQLFPRGTWAIINSTASLAVRECLASIEPKKLYPRIIETSLFANGTVGLIAVEGPGRNPNSVDLIAEAYELMRDDPKLRSKVFEADHPFQPRSIGQGCSSATMIVSDAQISMLAAAMSLGISRMRAEGLSESSGRILLGLTTEDGMGLNWKTMDVPPVQVIPVDENSSWTVRLTNRAHQKILKESADKPRVETGGILVGRISETQQAFIVTDALPAPQDSDRSQFQFTLGTSSVSRMLEQYASSCNHALYCLGTWHSHLSNSGPSERDRQTAREMATSRVAPFLLVIRTPDSYWAITTINF